MKSLRIYFLCSLPDLKHGKKRFIRICLLNIPEMWPLGTFQLIYQTVTMETINVRKISTSVLAVYFQVLYKVCKVSFPSSGRRKKLSMIKIFKLFVSFHLKNNVFKFASCVYKQIMGTTMGTPVAPNYLNLFMTQVKTNMLNDYEAENTLRLIFWLRYQGSIYDFSFLGEVDPNKIFGATQGREKNFRPSMFYFKKILGMPPGKF